MKITAIKQQVKNPERVSIFIDGKYSFSLSLNELLENKLKVGSELDESELKKLVKLSGDGKLKARAMEWLLSRPHSQKEFRDYLKRKKADPELVEFLQKEFIEKKYLDDASFTRWWIETRRSSKNSSNRKLNLELRQKGIATELISQYLEDTKDDEVEALKNVIAKKSRLSKYQNDDKKFITYLLSQGFSYSDIKQTLNK